MNKTCEDYCSLINNRFKNQVRSIIIYGSNIYDVSSSDLDVCVIADENNSELQEELIAETLKFHVQNNLKIDEEIPHNNKLIYTISEIEETLNNPPFFVNGEIVIRDIKKDSEFLCSKEMKQRLLLNILTTDHLTIGENTEEYEIEAFKIILNVILNYCHITDRSEEKILECMYQNPYTGAYGEMYLGYKKNAPEKEKYLKKKIHEVLHD